MKSRRQRRAPVPTLSMTAGVALVWLLASASIDTTSNNLADAFALPKLRSRNHHSIIAPVVHHSSKAPLEFEQFSEEEKAPKDKKNGEQQQQQPRKETNGKEVTNGAKPPLPGTPLISEETAESAESEDPFEIHLGRALDTLRKDYPHMLTDQPEFNIFDNDLEVIDPSGVKLHSLKNYKGAFRLMHAIVQLFYCPERSGLAFRLCYDTARQNIRVSWNAEVVPKAIFGGVRTTLHVDGISVYEISRKSGMITQHRIERLVINDTPVNPKQGIFAKLRNEHDESVPVFNAASKLDQDNSALPGPHAFEFRQALQSSLFASDEASDERLSSTALLAVSAGGNNDGDGPSQESYPGLDVEAYERKNASRKKFGLDPMTPEEFMETEVQVQKMDAQQRQRAASTSAAAEMTKQNKSRPAGFLEKLFGDIGPEACESNFDCQRPEICCNFGFKKVCCASGSMVGSQVLQLVPVPADVYQPGEEPEQPGARNDY